MTEITAQPLCTHACLHTTLTHESTFAKSCKHASAAHKYAHTHKDKCSHTSAHVHAHTEHPHLHELGAIAAARGLGGHRLQVAFCAVAHARAREGHAVRVLVLLLEHAARGGVHGELAIRCAL